ncbi:MAG: hypothetical protein ACQETB_12985 [Halobacteriota archaeon]
MSDGTGEATEDVPADRLPEEIREAVPVWDDEYFDRVSDRLMYNYDLQKDHVVAGERFDLYGELRMEIQKQFVHPALNYANHSTEEYLFARRVSTLRVEELERLVDVGHDLADEWIIADEEHFGTDFTFVVVCDSITDSVRSFVSSFSDRTLLKFGYYGHYEINLVVVTPDEEDAVASANADVLEAFTLWDDVTKPEHGFLSRLAHRFWR